jgi:hypothetical protein
MSGGFFIHSLRICFIVVTGDPPDMDTAMIPIAINIFIKKLVNPVFHIVLDPFIRRVEMEVRMQYKLWLLCLGKGMTVM